MTLQIYGDRVSGNCLKVKWTADHLAIPYAGSRPASCRAIPPSIRRSRVEAALGICD